jgi:protein-tyrosine phosphatase
MVPLADVHVHLCAGMDDGPRTFEDAVLMCRIAAAEGVRAMAATAHQNERWRDVTPERIRAATLQLRETLVRENIPVEVFPTAEVMAEPDTPRAWREERLLGIADRRNYILLEMPRGCFVDLEPTIRDLRDLGARTVLAHPEKEDQFLYGDGTLERLIEIGALVQVSASSVTDPKSPEELKALKSWFQRGMVHLLASDGHSPRKRPPLMAAAYREIARWIGPAAADRIASTNGLAVLEGQRVRVARPLPMKRKWFALASWWG